MNIKTQIFVAVLVLLMLIYLTNMVRSNRLELKYSLLWYALGAGILFFSIFPGAAACIAGWLGIGLPINLIFFAGFCFSLMIIYSLTTALSGLSEKVKRLTQEIGLLKKELEDIKKKYEAD